MLHSNLNNANLYQANLLGVNLYAANLQDANSTLSTLMIPSFTIYPSPAAKSLSEINPCAHQSALFLIQPGMWSLAKLDGKIENMLNAITKNTINEI